MQYKVPQNIDLADPSTKAYWLTEFHSVTPCALCGARLIGNEIALKESGYAV